MYAVALCAGICAGSVNYALLALGCGRFARGEKRAGIAFFLAGPSLPVLGLLACALISGALLPWFGLAAGAVLPLLATGQMIWNMLRKRR